MKNIFIILFIAFVIHLKAEITVKSVFPKQDKIGVEVNSGILIEIEHYQDSIYFNQQNLFKVFGSNSGLVKGQILVNSFGNVFTFIPENNFFSGEIIDVSFGPIFNEIGDTLSSFHWRFTTQINNPTNANLDSLKRFSYPSFNPIAIDYDKDGDVDILSQLGVVILNDGKGNFNSIIEVPEMYDMKFIDDLNNDGFHDLIISGDVVEIYFGSETDGYILSEMLYPFNMKGGIIIGKGDFNGDGYIDLIGLEEWGTFDNLWRKFINDGNGKFIRDSNAVYLQNYITKAELIDMNKDGYLDLVLLNSWPSNPSIEFAGAYIYYNDGKGNFDNFVNFPFHYEVPPYFEMTYTDLTQINIGDFNGNGLNDIAGLGQINGGLVMFQDSINKFVSFENASFSGSENTASFTSCDINGDNRLDIILSNQIIIGENDYPVKMTILLNNDPICFGFWCDSIPNIIELGSQIEVGSVIPITADVDNDGDLDIINSGYPITVNYNNNVITSITNKTILPEKLLLYQNYPNPFNPSTVIKYSIPNNTVIAIRQPTEKQSAEITSVNSFPRKDNMNVKLVVYDILGREITTLVNEVKLPGTYEVIFDSKDLPSGLYFYRLQSGEFIKTKKMLLLK